MAGRLAAVPELSTTGFTPPSSLRNTYRDSIRSVPVYGGYVRPNLFSQPGHSGSGNSSDSSSYQSNNSGSSSGSVAADFSGACELTKIAHRMISDGFTQGMVQEFGTGAADRALESWFFELDVDWVLQVREGQLQDKPASSLREMIERWIRALTVVVLSIKELVHHTPAIARFGHASISAMLVFVDAVVPALEAERKLQAVVNMYICVSSASYHTFTTPVIYPEAQSILNEIGGSLSRQVDGLSEAIASTMEEMTTLMEDHDSWDVEIQRGGGEVHMNTRLMVNCIVSIRKARSSTHNDTGDLHDLIDDTMGYLKDLLLKKSELCSDPSLRYLFLLNNYNFIAEVFEPSVSVDLELWSGRHWRPTPECEKYMYNYLEVSWGHVLSCIPRSRFPGPLLRWVTTSSLAKFESAFHKTYHAQKLWKVPDPRLRAALRRAITKMVISGYCDYLGEHPELEKHVGRESSSPAILEVMLGELFEG